MGSDSDRRGWCGRVRSARRGRFASAELLQAPRALARARRPGRTARPLDARLLIRPCRSSSRPRRYGGRGPRGACGTTRGAPDRLGRARNRCTRRPRDSACYAGRTAAGLAAFDQAVQRSSGVHAARVLTRRRVVLRTWASPAALEDLGVAIVVLRRTVTCSGRLARSATAAGLCGPRSTSRADAVSFPPRACSPKSGRNWRRPPRSTIVRSPPSHPETSRPRSPSSMRQLLASSG